MVKDKLNYQALQQELDEIVFNLQSGDVDLGETVKLYKRSQELIKELEKILKKAEINIKELKQEKI
jgi:exodeoxyribonuclease VII small subunit